MPLLAIAPIAVVLLLMTGWRWGAHKAGPGGWLTSLIIAVFAFGLTPQVFWTSQAKGLLLSAFVLAVMWPALFLFHWLNTGGGITAIATTLRRFIADTGMCALMMAWALSGVLEGIAGFGLPVAIVSPMLVAIGIPPLRAVAAVAIGHCWAVSFGSMGIIFETLAAITGLHADELVGWAGILLGATCFGCGMGAAFVLDRQRHWPTIVTLSAVMGATQYVIAAAGLVPLSALGAGIAGLSLYTLAQRRKSKPASIDAKAGDNQSVGAQPSSGGSHKPLASDAAAQQEHVPSRDCGIPPGPRSEAPSTPQLANARPLREPLAAYTTLAVLMAALTLIAPFRAVTNTIAWKPGFAEVTTRHGYTTPAESGPTFRLFTHPGALIALVSFAAVGIALRGKTRVAIARLGLTAKATWHSGAYTSLGVISMVGVSAMMEHTGMSLLLAQSIGKLLGAAYPLASPFVGVLGAFATGSNNNSNIMFGPLQKNVAILLNLSPALLIAAQTAGGSLGSLLAPAKIVVGCSTVGLAGQEGLVLKRTIPYGIAIGLCLGVITLICAASFS
jgi:lactate permease